MSRISEWLPALSMTAVSLISYVDRNTLALLSPTILTETGLSAEQYGWIISAFSIAYMIGNPTWGRLLDRFGLRVGMSAAVGFWSLASACHALAGGFWSFAVARAALGFGEGATFPGGLRTVMQTLDAHLRARGIALAYSGGSLGAILTPPLVTQIASRWGWRGAFWFTGFIGALWLLWWSRLSRRARLRHPAPDHTHLAAPRLGDPRIWSFMAVYALGALPVAFVLYTTAIYLQRVLALSQTTIGWLLWIPPFGWELGYFFWGWRADRAGLRAGAPAARFRSYFFVLMLLSLPLALAPHARPLSLLMAQLFLAMFIAAGFIILSVAYATSVFSVDHAGYLAGLGAGSWSAVVAAVMPVFGAFIDRRQYGAGFALAAAFPALGWLLWRLMNRDGSPSQAGG